LPDQIGHCTREELGLRNSAAIFWSGQSLFKYLPQYDDVFARIAKGVPDSQFVFIAHSGASQVTDVFRSRLEQSFNDRSLNSADHCVFIDRMETYKFRAAMGTADVFLDSIGWSGCNSTFEILSHNLPIITLPGETMRSRHTMAILKMMDVTDTIASDLDDYVELAIKLGSDRYLRERVSEKIARNKRKVFRDRSCIVALEDFLEAAVRGKDAGLA